MIKAILNFAASIGLGFDVPPRQAIDYFKSKGLKLGFSYADVYREEHATSFTVAKMMEMDLLNDVHQSLIAAMESGEGYHAWADKLTPLLQEKGWWGRKEVKDPVTGKTIIAELGSPYRLELIYRTNMQSAYSVGHWLQIMEQVKQAPWLMYDAVDDGRTRPMHRFWDNTILRYDHVFWKTHYPPNGYLCRCGVIQLSDSDLKSMGLKPSESPKITYTTWQNPRTGKNEKIPEGIDPSFDYNPGQARYNQLKLLADEKAGKLPGELNTAANSALEKINEVAKPELLKPSDLTVDKVVKLGESVADRLNLDDLVKLAEDTPVYSLEWDKAANEWRDNLISDLSDVRELGGTINASTGSSPAAKGMLDEAVQRFPAEWVKKAEKNGQLFVALAEDAPGGRGFLAPVAQDGPLMGYGEVANLTTDDFMLFIGDGSVSTHEYAHRIQQALPELDYFFQTEHKLRTKGQELKRMMDLEPGVGYGPDEWAREDHYFEPYQGKEYEVFGAAEVMTMAIEPILGIRGEAQIYLHKLIQLDRRMVELVLGLLFYVNAGEEE